MRAINQAPKVISRVLFVGMSLLLLTQLLGVCFAQAPGVTGNSTPPPGNATSTIPPVAASQTTPSSISEKDILEQAFRQIDTEARRLDRLIANAETVGKIVATLVIGLSVVISIFGFQNMRELKRDVQASVAEHVDAALREESQSKQTFQFLVTALKDAETKWQDIKASIQQVERFYAATEAQFGDAQGAYKTVRAISKKTEATEEDRRVALTYLGKLVKLGIEGRVDPNTLFNASTSASDLDFDFEAVQLATLCAYWDPKPSHMARKNRLEDVFGVRFVLKDNKLERDAVSANEVRRQAWATALAQIRGRPTVQCELILAEAHNIAVRNMESGLINDLIGAMEEATPTEGEDGDSRPSYAFVILAGLYAMRGGSRWRGDYDRAVGEAVERLRQESPMATWYQHTIRDLIQNAGRLGEKTAMLQRLADGQIAVPDGDEE